MRFVLTTDLSHAIILKLSSGALVDDLSLSSYFLCVSSQFPSHLEGSGMTWDNKRGWSIPREIIDSAPMLIGARCVATHGGKVYQSVNYLFHTTGKKHYISVNYRCFKGSVFSGVSA